MRVLVSGDWHLCVSNYGVLDENGRNSRLVDVEKALQRMVDVAEEQQVALLICSGDIFHTNRPTIEEQLVFWRLLQRLESCNFNSRLIIGNHDYNSKLGASHALKLFMDITKTFQKVVIYDETSWELFGDYGDIKPLLVCFYPYHATPPDFEQAKQFGETQGTALVCHSHLEGAVVGAEPFEIKDDKATKFSDLPVRFVWAGHFHKPQILSQSPLAFYPGSIQCVDFSERFDVKGVVIVDTVTAEYECVGINVRKFVQIDVDATEERWRDTDGYPCIHPDCLFEVGEAIVKVNVKMTERQAEGFDESVMRELLTKHHVHSIAGINVDIIREEIKRNPTIKLDSDLSNNFLRFIEDRKYGDKTDVVKETGLKIIKQCTS